MLTKLLNEIQTAIQNAKVIKDTMGPDGKTIIQSRKQANLFGRTVEVIIDIDPKSGAKNYQFLDQATGRLINYKRRTDDQRLARETAHTDLVLSLLEACTMPEHAKNLEARKAWYNEESAKQRELAWRRALEKTSYPPKMVDVFIEYAVEAAKDPMTVNRARLFIQILTAFETEITRSELDPEPGRKGRGPKPRYNMKDIMFNTLCKLTERRIKDRKGQNIIPMYVIDNCFLNEESEAMSPNMSQNIKHVRAVLRQIYDRCGRKTGIFAFIVDGLVKYYESETGETVKIRIAKNYNRHHDPKAKTEFGSLGDLIGDSLAGFMPSTNNSKKK